ncbi:patatin-like phospholipase family protein [Fibrella aquatilis]|uniref:Patatin-like phospholipase family protein n=1 Tax=Fibrella aquatilis TaxID=2817059 RepID=A0A939G973_9BACT|nr:patatin-like phospholipase family protein [Fibrella aquatilis]MBO0934549.1 patatin-like phospholipase family protein [Fibrella aquatilis]
MSSPLRTRLLQFLDKQAPNRVYWLLLTLVVGGLVTFIENQFDGQDIHSLTARYVDSGLNPMALIRRWESNRQRLAWLEVLVDTVLFIPAYLTTLTVWCWYFSAHTLFVTNPYQPHIARFMRRFGQLATGVMLVGAAADLVENQIMMGWLLYVPISLPPWAVGLIRLLKLAPIALAVFFILLHPLGIVFSLREAFFRLLGVTGFTQNDGRRVLLNHIISRRKNEKAIDDALADLREQHPVRARPLRFRDYLSAAWKGFLNVQYVVYLLLMMGGLFQLDQFDELFFFLLTEWRGVWVSLATLVALGLWGGMVYVCSKILLFVQPNFFGDVDPGDARATAKLLLTHQRELRLLRNTPKWLAYSPFLIMLVTLGLNYNRLRPDEQGNPDYAFKYVILLLALAAAYWLFTRIINYFHRSLDERDIVLFKSVNPARDYALLVDLAPRSILFGQGLLVAALMAFLPTATGLVLAKSIGLYAIVLLWLAALTYFITILYQFNRLPNYPILVVLVGAVLIFSRYNDNSAIRESPLPTRQLRREAELAPSPALLRPTLAAYYTRWLQTRLATPPGQPVDSTSPLPVVVIATAGGGIRAAAWTTEVLAALNEQIPQFDRHLFGISGVSGGGVGAATYVALRRGGQSPTAAEFGRRLRYVVTEDLVSPTVASMLFRGGVHNFMPLPVPALDRNRWLEDAWERRMLTTDILPDSVTRRDLPQSFLSFWPSAGAALDTASLTLPALLLNGAVAETGQKIIMTNLALGNTADVRNPFYDVADLFASAGHDVPYKTATFLCARFPFVTSGGRSSGPLPNISDSNADHDYHIIDGGYAENTGLLTAVQLIKNMQRIEDDLRRHPPVWLGCRPVQYYLLFLPNSAAAETKGPLGAFRFLTEPVQGFLRTWDRNGVGLNQLIGRTLRRDRGGLSFDYTSLVLDTKNHHYPLGWYISPTAVARMGEQVNRNLADSLNPKAGQPATLFSLLKQQIKRGKEPPVRK